MSTKIKRSGLLLLFILSMVVAFVPLLIGATAVFLRKKNSRSYRSNSSNVSSSTTSTSSTVHTRLTIVSRI